MNNMNNKISLLLLKMERGEERRGKRRREARGEVMREERW
jgi:hypothetical protein